MEIMHPSDVKVPKIYKGTIVVPFQKGDRAVIQSDSPVKVTGLHGDEPIWLYDVCDYGKVVRVHHKQLLVDHLEIRPMTPEGLYTAELVLRENMREQLDPTPLEVSMPEPMSMEERLRLYMRQLVEQERYHEEYDTEEEFFDLDVDDDGEVPFSQYEVRQMASLELDQSPVEGEEENVSEDSSGPTEGQDGSEASE